MKLYLNVKGYDSSIMSFNSEDIDNIINFYEMTSVIDDYGFEYFFITNILLEGYENHRHIDDFDEASLNYSINEYFLEKQEEENLRKVNGNV